MGTRGESEPARDGTGLHLGNTEHISNNIEIIYCTSDHCSPSYQPTYDIYDKTKYTMKLGEADDANNSSEWFNGSKIGLPPATTPDVRCIV